MQNTLISSIHQTLIFTDCFSQQTRRRPPSVYRLPPNYDACLMPYIEELLEWLGKADVSTLHLTRGYWQAPLEEQDHKKTNNQTELMTPFGLHDPYDIKTMPLDFKEQEPLFSKWMAISEKRAEEYLGAYIKGIRISSITRQNYLVHLQDPFQRLKIMGLTARPKNVSLRQGQHHIQDIVFTTRRQWWL